MDTTEFDEIVLTMMRNFLKSLRSLIADPAFQKAATDAIPNVPFELLAQKIRACKSKPGFSGNILLWYFMENSSGPYGWADSGSYGCAG